MAFWAYMLRCADGTYYTGHTDNLEHRMAQHAVGATGGYTATRMPVELVWSSEFATRYEALSAERQIKGWSKAKKEELIRGDWSAIQRLARRRQSFETPQSSTSAPQDERRWGGNSHRTSPTNFPTAVRAEEGPRTQSENPSRSTRADTKPIIVLVRPQLGENIGKAARAMLNFGLGELRLVEPRDGWPNPAAGPAASGADVVLERTQVFATTVRKRGVTKPVVTPEAAAREIHARPGRSAILFGPERSGLETSDVALARTILTVPINPEFGSLNLAQAVILVAYEWSKSQDLVQPTEEELLPPAPQAELEGLIAHFTRLLTPKGYFLPVSRAEATSTTLRTMLTKPGWNHLEVRTLRGVLSALERTEERQPR